MSTSRDFLLIVDDEKEVCQSIREFLEEKNYAVITAPSGEEGLKILKEKGEGIPVVISDQRMPGMNGADFLALVAQNYPKTATILLTGYTDLEPAVSAINNASITYYIQKEDVFKELETAVRKGLDENESRILEERARKMTAQGPSAMTKYQVINVGIVSDENRQSLLTSAISAFQMNAIRIDLAEFNERFYERQKNLHVLFIDVDQLGWEKVPSKPVASSGRPDEKDFPYVIPICSDPKKCIPHLKQKGLFDCLDQDCVKNPDKLSRYLMQLPTIGEDEFKKAFS